MTIIYSRISTAKVDRKRVEQIRAQNMTRMADNKRLLIRTHKNAAICDLLEFIDTHVPFSTESTG